MEESNKNTEMLRQPNILVGKSLTLELYLEETGEHNGYDKIGLTNYELGIGGSSFLIANALNKLECSPTLLGFIGYEDRSGLLELLNHNMSQAGIAIKTIPCLEKTNISVIDRISNRELIHEYKSPIISGEFMKQRDDLKRYFSSYEWRIASGVGDSEEEMLMTADMFDSRSNNVLIPKINLLQSSEKLRSLLPHTNILSINNYEFLQSALTLKEFNECGVDLIIVTNSNKGGMYSFHGEEASYEAFPIEHSEIFPTGAGDWFTASIVAYLVRNNIASVSNATFKEIEHAILFAAEIAAKKIGCKGAVNGPTLDFFPSSVSVT
jgi:sugar/nucleoside kinase (ribokinase family)